MGTTFKNGLGQATNQELTEFWKKLKEASNTDIDHLIYTSEYDLNELVETFEPDIRILKDEKNSYTGAEDGERETQMIYSLNNNDEIVYFSIYGSYDSYNGTDWWDSEVYRVKPIEVTKIEFIRD